MNKLLLIIFVKNINQGTVKTRLAKTIGEEKACEVYKHLVDITENAINSLFMEKRVYFSNTIIDKKWLKTIKKVQKGEDLGQKMQNSFKNGFDDGFEKIILIGSDLPDISAKIINEGFDQLENNEVVFGPAEDGGYYLLGMTKHHFCIFENKPWSQSNLLAKTKEELKKKKICYSLLETLNDIDTEEDLKNSIIGPRYL